MAVHITPLHDRVLVKRIEEKETVKGGIIIPDTAKEKPQEGEVIAVGEGKMPIRQIFEALIKIKYPGFVDLEYEIHADDPMPGVIESFSYMRGVLSGMGYNPISTIS